MITCLRRWTTTSGRGQAQTRPPSCSDAARGSGSNPSACRGLASALATAAASLVLCGCASSALHSARRDFYAGNIDRAAATLGSIPPASQDRVLALMERGTIQQARGDFESSTADWTEAAELAEQLDYFSVSEGTASLVINDRVKAFRGMPYEHTLLHAFAAKSYMALSLWHDAAVEARVIADGLQDLNGFPDDPYSRYVAGFCFEMIGDTESAKFQYRAASKAHAGVDVDDQGRIVTAGTPPAPRPVDGTRSAAATELVCFIAFGRVPGAYASSTGTARWGQQPYAELYSGGQRLGRSHLLADTKHLLSATESRVAAMRAAKTVTRIAIKEAAAHAVYEENEALGMLLRIILYAIEVPDTRRWETLPRWLHVARVPCPEDLGSLEVILRGAGGTALQRHTVTKPITRRRNLHFAFLRAL